MNFFNLSLYDDDSVIFTGNSGVVTQAIYTDIKEFSVLG